MENKIDELLKKLNAAASDLLEEEKIRKQIYVEEVRRNDDVRKNTIETNEAIVQADKERAQRVIEDQHSAASRHQDWLDECARVEEFRQQALIPDTRIATALESIAIALAFKG